MNQLVLSRTASLVPLRTGPSCYRRPGWGLTRCSFTPYGRRNSTNRKSSGFLLTDCAIRGAGDNRQQASDRPASSPYEQRTSGIATELQPGDRNIFRPRGAS